LVMFFIKIFGWYATNSVVVLSVLLDSLIDGVMSIVIFFSLRYAMQPADKEHRFGHGKAEAITAFLQSVILFVASAFLMWQVGLSFYKPHQIGNIQIGVVVSAIGAGITLLLIALQTYTIRKTGSLALRADSLHYRVDVLLYVTTMLALLLTQFFGDTRIDALFAAVVAVYIAWQALQILLDATKQLMDHELPDDTREQIKQCVRSHAQVRDLYHLRTRMSGRRPVIQFLMEVQGDTSLTQACHISDEVEQALIHILPNADVIISLRARPSL